MQGVVFIKFLVDEAVKTFYNNTNRCLYDKNFTIKQ